MKICRQLILLALLLCSIKVTGQTTEQPNIDFELGTTSMWSCYTGVCCPLITSSPSPAIPGRHTITSGNAVDPYGFFPIVAPDGGKFSLKLGNDDVNSEAERVEYHVHVPAGVANYSLVYRYAVVFEDPQHDPADQPRFAVNTYDSATGVAIACAQFLYVASSALPGYKLSSVGFDVYYKDWTTGSIDLSGYSGRTIIIDFSTGDCALGGHFGYGYVDLNSGLFAVSNSCDINGGVLTGPSGFDKYLWYDNGFTHLLDSVNNFSYPGPTGPTTYALVLQPYPGYGCADTLYSTVYPMTLKMDPIGDTTICDGSMLAYTAHTSGGTGNLSYLWSPLQNISCVNCQSTIIKPDVTGQYTVKVIDTTGCAVSDTINITVDGCGSLFIPNAFTPNGDGKNDIIRVIGNKLEHCKDFTFSIFNRFGQMVFYTENVYAGWDGFFNGVEQELGAYYYLVTYSLYNEKQMLKGDITLVR